MSDILHSVFCNPHKLHPPQCLLQSSQASCLHPLTVSSTTLTRYILWRCLLQSSQATCLHLLSVFYNPHKPHVFILWQCLLQSSTSSQCLLQPSQATCIHPLTVSSATLTSFMSSSSSVSSAILTRYMSSSSDSVFYNPHKLHVFSGRRAKHPLTVSSPILTSYMSSSSSVSFAILTSLMSTSSSVSSAILYMPSSMDLTTNDLFVTPSLIQQLFSFPC